MELQSRPISYGMRYGSALMDLDQLIADYTRELSRRDELPPGVSQVTREVPIRAPSVTGDVWAPLLIALISALVVFLSAGTLALVAGWTVKVPLVFAGATLAAIWFGHLSRGWDRLIWAVEELSGVDVNQDGDVGKPTISIEVSTRDDPNSLSYLHLPGTADQLRALAAGVVYQSRPLSEAEWTGSGAPYSRREFRDLMARLDAAGAIRWKDERYKTQGREVTAFGRRVLAQLAEGTHARMPTQRGPDALPAQVGEGRGDG